MFAATGRQQVDILELQNLEKEYFLSRSRLTLAQHHPSSAAVAGMCGRETHVTNPIHEEHESPHT